MDARYFSDKVVEWYVRNKRDLPWREDSDPYKIWLSEVILQQTRVIQGLPYYRRFVDRFPTVEHLAAASEQEVLRLWQGLGYYSRARNLLKCAREIVANHAAIFPGTSESLRQLSGIGPYTAAAIASIAFGEKVAVVDGNVFRVLSRVFGVDADIASPQGRKIFHKLANDLMSNSPALHNQAVMEFGALQCLPKNPGCSFCDMRAICAAAAGGLQHQLPVKGKPRKSRKRYFYYFVLRRGKSILMKRRQEKDIWQGLYDFYLVEKTRRHRVADVISEVCQQDNLHFDRESTIVSGTYKHILTHQLIYSRFILVDRFSGNRPNGSHRFFTTRKIDELPKPALISRFLNDSHLS
jgi:A/G-specific adenine glycosylase